MLTNGTAAAACVSAQPQRARRAPNGGRPPPASDDTEIGRTQTSSLAGLDRDFSPALRLEADEEGFMVG